MNIANSVNWRNIGVSVSGGADSALLAYLLAMSTNFASIHVITEVRCWKTRPWQRQNSLDVYRWLTRRFPNRSFSRHEGFIPPELEWGSKGPTIEDEYGKLKSGNQIILRAHTEFLIHQQKLEAVFASVNKNPDITINGELEDRNNPTMPEEFEHMGARICHPFVNVQKDWIMQQYYDHDILDLLELTRSCEGDKNDYPDTFKDLDYTTYALGQSVPTCEQCFWCKEREWGLARIKK